MPVAPGGALMGTHRIPMLLRLLPSLITHSYTPDRPPYTPHRYTLTVISFPIPLRDAHCPGRKRDLEAVPPSPTPVLLLQPPHRHTLTVTHVPTPLKDALSHGGRRGTLEAAAISPTPGLKAAALSPIPVLKPAAPSSTPVLDAAAPFPTLVLEAAASSSS